MKKLLYFIVVASVMLSACTKKNGPAPTSVSINGTVYNTVIIGSQTWTAINYNGPGGITTCSCSPFFSSKFYTFAEAEAITLPKGWRLPSLADYNKLTLLVGATNNGGPMLDYTTVDAFKLMSANNWPFAQGTNSLGFNAFPVGTVNAGTTAEFWTSTFDEGVQLPLEFAIVQPSAQITHAGIDAIYANADLSIRFVKDN